MNEQIHATIRFCVVTAAITLILWQNASKFDATEWKAIFELAVVVGGYETVSTFMRSRNNSNPDSPKER